MTRISGARVLLLAICLKLALVLYAAERVAAPTEGRRPAEAAAQGELRLKPGPDDGSIAFVTARLLEHIHYSRLPFDDAKSSQLLDRYIESLDPQHMHFTQADLAQFERYRTILDDLTLSRRGVADTTPAYEIFTRFYERLDQRVSYSLELLQTEKFTFDTDERIAVSRSELPYPKDLTEARKLWRERLLYEYLQERLSRVENKKKTLAAAEKKPSDGTDTAKKAGPAKSIHDEIVETLTRRYERNLRTFRDWNSDDVLQVYLSAMSHVWDPHSDYLGKAQLESFAISMNLALFGIGAELYSDDGYCTIRKLIPGGPAALSKKIGEKDRIIGVAQGDADFVDVVDMNLNKVVQMIRGPKGTEVRLKVAPAADSSARTIVKLVRDKIKLEDQAAKSKIIELPNANGSKVRLGMIDLPSFYASMDTDRKEGSDQTSTTADVARLLKKLKEENVKGVILDLRRNGGGSLEEAVKLTGLFIKKGPVVQVKAHDNSVFVDEDTDPSVLYDGPLIVLTSRFSASASEILAGALQDYGRALIVGDSSTHGKGTVQNINYLQTIMRPSDLTTSDPGALKVTIRKFYRASGASTQLKGIMPDIVLPSVFNHSKDIGEAALKNPLPWDTIPSAKFDRLDMVQPYLQELLKRSTERVATNQDFAYVREDIEQYRKLQADKTISLNEKQRIREKEEADARQKARDQERMARQAPEHTVYELPLKLTDVPGLPPPVERTNTVAGKTGLGSGAGATSAAISPAETDPDAALDADEDKPPTIDYVLDEAQRILIDYLSLLSKKSMLSATP